MADAPHLYCSVADLRAEGVTEAEADDARLGSLIEDATLEIDDHCGWWFDAQTRTVKITGDGSRILDLPAPLISLTSVEVDGAALDLDDLRILGPAPIRGGRYDEGPALYNADTWYTGRHDITVVGVFGRTEHDGTAEGRVPRAIRRACMLMVLRHVAPLADDDPARAAGRVRRMRTRTQEVEFRDVEPGEAPYTGDPEIDEILLRYRAPMGLGAA